MTRVLFLDVDGVLLAPVDDQSCASVDLPLANRTWVDTPLGGRALFDVAIEAVRVIRDLPADVSVRLLSSWLISPDHLRGLRSALGLERADIADLASDCPSRDALQGRESDLGHFKVRAVMRELVAGRSVLWVDDGVHESTANRVGSNGPESLTVVVPSGPLLDQSDARKIANWAFADSLARDGDA
jgi:hypothetical protein